MAISIPKNTYSTPTEIREYVVQKICEAFLDKCTWSVFHPGNDGRYRSATLNVLVQNGKGYGFNSKAFSINNETSYRVRGVEIKRAFEELIKAGYHMFEVYTYGTWKGYICHNKPFFEKGIEVKSFNDSID